MNIREEITKKFQLLKIWWWNQTTPYEWMFDVDQEHARVRRFEHDGGGAQLLFKRQNDNAIYCGTVVYDDQRPYLGLSMGSREKLPFIARLRSKNAQGYITQRDKDFMEKIGQPVDLPVKEFYGRHN